MYLELFFIVLILVLILYLLYILYTKNANTLHKKIKKKVNFFGIPTEIDRIKPVFKSSKVKLIPKEYRFNPMNNTEHYENNHIQEDLKVRSNAMQATRKQNTEGDDDDY
jgi:hypothetical protein